MCGSHIILFETHDITHIAYIVIHTLFLCMHTISLRVHHLAHCAHIGHATASKTALVFVGLLFTYLLSWCIFFLARWIVPNIKNIAWARYWSILCFYFTQKLREKILVKKWKDFVKQKSSKGPFVAQSIFPTKPVVSSWILLFCFYTFKVLLFKKVADSFITPLPIFMSIKSICNVCECVWHVHVTSKYLEMEKCEMLLKVYLNTR